MFERRHFNEIARIISTIEPAAREAAAYAFAWELRDSNPAFDQARFLQACIGTTALRYRAGRADDWTLGPDEPTPAFRGKHMGD